MIGRNMSCDHDRGGGGGGVRMVTWFHTDSLFLPVAIFRG